MPDSLQLVITDTTPIITLSLVGKLDLLQQLYGEVLVPPAVYAEVIAGGRRRTGVLEIQAATWLRETQLPDPTRADLLADLDRGEAEAIALAQVLGADLLIIDERLGRRHAQRLGLTITGTLGVLLRAKNQGFISEIGSLIEEMRKGGIRFSDDLVARTLKLAGESVSGRPRS
jgi:predicted nucleic acid-binding protein